MHPLPDGLYIAAHGGDSVIVSSQTPQQQSRVQMLHCCCFATDQGQSSGTTGLRWACCIHTCPHASGRHAYLGLLHIAVAGEDDQVGLERLQAVDILLQRLQAAVAAAVVDGDADRGRQLAGNASLLRVGCGVHSAGTGRMRMP